ncbi:MAG TPA: PH domain-containing protein [Phycisphaerae bacterium]|nr:PH domain-containing protein [Phycisphaerae bacterium]
MVSEPSVEEPGGRLDAGRSLPLATPADRFLSHSAPDEIENEMPIRARIISPSLLLPAEVVIFEVKPSLWYVVFASLPIAAVGLTLTFLVCVIEQLYAIRYLGAVIGMWLIGLRIAFALLQWLGRTYVLTDRRILMQSGVLEVGVESMPLEDIENTFVAQAVAQRVLGIGKIFFRAGSPHCASLAWEHIRRPKEVHAHIVAQIDRWKNSLAGLKGK